MNTSNLLQEIQTEMKKQETHRKKTIDKMVQNVNLLLEVVGESQDKRPVRQTPKKSTKRPLQPIPGQPQIKNYCKAVKPGPENSKIRVSVDQTGFIQTHRMCKAEDESWDMMEHY